MMNIKDILLHEADYENEMLNVVIPYTKEYEKDGYFEASDNAKIYYRTYIKDDSLKNIVIVHGFTENCEKYRELIYYFLKSGFNVFAFDLRGHGYSERFVEDITKIHVDSFDEYVLDLKDYIDKIVVPESKGMPILLYSHSMGGAVSVLYLEKFNKVIKKAVLSTPMIVQRTYVPGPLLKLHIFIKTKSGKDKDYLPFVLKGFPDRERFDLVSNGSRIRYSYYYKVCTEDKNYRTFSGTVAWMRECIAASNELKQIENVQKIDIPIEVFCVKKDIRVRTHPL